MTFSVKVKDIDTSLLGSGGRTLSIRPSHKPQFTTPTHPFSKPDYTAKSYLAFRGTLNGNIGTIPIDIRGKRYQRFCKNNGTVDYIRRNITKFSDKMCFNENFTILDVLPTKPSNQKIQKLYLEMQLTTTYLNYISMPPIQTSNMTTYDHLINDWQNNAEQYNKGAAPTLSLSENQKNFNKKLNLLCELAENDTIDIINLEYANPNRYPHQYVSLWEKRENNVLFNCFKVPRKTEQISPNVKKTPNLELQRYGIDTITYITKTPSPKYIASLQYKEALTSTDQLIFDWPHYPAGIILTSTYWKKLPPHSTECSCKVCKKQLPHEIIEQYCYNDQKEIDHSSMDYVSKLHSGLSSELENKKIQQYIKSNEIQHYHQTLEENQQTHKTTLKSKT